MAQFASDTFTDSDGVNLPTHDANWVKHGSSGSSQLIITNENRVRVGTTDSSEALYYHTGSPASADYTVKADFLKRSDVSGAIFVCGRMSTSANTFYGWRYARDTGVSLAAWQLYKRVAGTFTQLGSSVNQTLTTDVAYEGKLSMSGSTIEGYKEGSGTPSVSTTDTAITAAGKAGLRGVGYTSTNVSSLHIDNFSADDIAGGSSPTLTASLSAAVQQSQALAAAMSAAVQVSPSATATTNAAVQAALSAQTGLDGAVSALRSAVASVQAAVQSSGSASASTDSAVQRAVTAAVALDLAVQAQRTATASMSAQVQAGSSVATSLDAYVQAGSSLSVSLSAAVLAQALATVGADAAVSLARQSTTGLSSALQTAMLAVATIDAAVQSARSASVGLSAQVQGGFEVSASIDAAVQQARTATAGVQAAIAVAGSASASMGAAVAVQRSVQAAMEAAVQAMRASTSSMSAYVQAAELPPVPSAQPIGHRYSTTRRSSPILAARRSNLSSRIR